VFTGAAAPSIIRLVPISSESRHRSPLDAVRALMRRPWAPPALLLVVAAVVGAIAFAYVKDVNDDIDRRDEAVQILSQMETSTARLGNLAALGQEPSLLLHAAGDAFAVRQTLEDLLRRWEEVYWHDRPPAAIVQLRRTLRILTQRLGEAVRGNPRAGRASAAELAQGDQLYHEVAQLRGRVSAEASDSNAAGDTRVAVVTGSAIGFVVVLLALFQLNRTRLRRMRRDTVLREALHEATRESEERSRYVMNLVPDQIFTIGADGRIDYMNERTAAFLGRDVDEVSERWLDLHHPDDALHVQTSWSNAMRGGEQVEVESRMLGADGDYHWILTRAIPQRGEDGRIVRWFCSGTDITGRQAQEQQLREARQRLAEAQSVAHIGSWEWDIAQDEVHWSDELHRLYGVPGDARLGYESFLDLVHPDDRIRVETVIREAIEERRSYEFECRIIRPDGEERNFFSRGQVQTDETDRPLRIVGVAQDITDRVRAERERDRLEAELHQAQRLESIGQLAGGVAHDFNNLLAVILNYAASVRARVTDPSVQEDAAEIEHAVEQAAALTRQLLRFGSQELVEPTDLDLNDVVNDMSNMLRHTLGDRAALEPRLAGDLWQVRADPGQLGQVLVNLALNARDAMPSGGVLRIETWNVEGRDGRGPRVRLVVRDTGTGMTDDVRRRAFEPFFTTKPTGAGTGLGLATVYGIVKGAGGEVTIESEPGHGTQVTVELPAITTPSPAASVDGHHDGGRRVLLVEDEEPVRRIAVRMLARHGYDVVAPESPAEALALVSQGADGFDLLMTDIVMPQMSGTDLATRARDVQPGLKVLFMSGYSERQGEAAENGVFLSKPFDEQSMLAKVREALMNEYRAAG
jgi:PAS domain S-box-containing protein